jgi:hypothetical protein
MLLRSALLPVTAAIVLGCFGCAGATGPEEAPPAVASGSGTAAIAKLVSRDRSITLLAGHGTVRATVLDGSGNLIARDVPIDDLQAIDATAYDACHGSFAGAQGPSGIPGADGRLLLGE